MTVAANCGQNMIEIKVEIKVAANSVHERVENSKLSSLAANLIQEMTAFIVSCKFCILSGTKTGIALTI